MGTAALRYGAALIILTLCTAAKWASASVDSGAAALNGHLRPHELDPSVPQDRLVSVKAITEQYRSVISRGKDRSSTYPSLAVRVEGYKDWGSVALTGKGEGFMTVTQTGNRYVNIPEFYFGSGGRPQHFLVHGGRKKEDWSRLDETWKLGLFQPRFRWDYFDPEVVGLSGMFFTTKASEFRFMAFATPLFIPEQGAPFDQQNGQFVSAHPFFSPPPRTMKVFGETTPLRYDVQIPALEKIVLNPAGGGLVSWGLDTGPWIKAGYAYKPMNQLPIGYDGYLYIPTNEVQVKIEPRVTYHHIGSFEGGYHGENADAWLGVLGELPEEQNVPTNYTIQNFGPALAVSPNVGYRFSGDGPATHRMDFGAIQTFGGVRDDSGSLAAPGQQIVESRYQYRTAVMGQWRLPLYAAGRKALSLKSRAIYDFSVQGTLLSGELKYTANNRWAVALGADVIGSGRAKSNQGQGGAEFFNLYRANDRVRGSIAYAF